jgi:cardiolipin synthase
MRSRRIRRHKRGGVRRLAAGALALSSTIGRTVGSRSLTATEASSVALIGFVLLALAALIALFPVLVVLPVVIALAWFGSALLIRAFRLKRRVRLRRRKLELRRRLAKAKEKEAPEAEVSPAE